jgi:NTE family protein
MGFFDFFKFRKKPKEIKIGLALGSGGAKGFAELGAIKALEENGIKFDYISGASIGSIIGAFLANEYSATDIVELLTRVDFSEIKNLFMIKMSTAGMFNVIDRTIGNMNIEELKKPFRCTATNMETGDEFVFSKGSVALALCASASYPPFFKPVVINGERFIDGAFTNSVPADLVKELGADYVIGIDLSNHQSKPSLLSRIFPTFKSKIEEPWQKGYENSNVMLKPDLSNYSAVSFSDWHKMFDIGYEEALKHIPKILKDIDQLKNQKKK